MSPSVSHIQITFWLFFFNSENCHMKCKSSFFRHIWTEARLLKLKRLKTGPWMTDISAVHRLVLQCILISALILGASSECIFSPQAGFDNKGSEGPRGSPSPLRLLLSSDNHDATVTVESERHGSAYNNNKPSLWVIACAIGSKPRRGRYIRWAQWTSWRNKKEVIF